MTLCDGVFINVGDNVPLAPSPPATDPGEAGEAEAEEAAICVRPQGS